MGISALPPSAVVFHLAISVYLHELPVALACFLSPTLHIIGFLIRTRAAYLQIEPRKAKLMLQEPGTTLPNKKRAVSGSRRKLSLSKFFSVCLVNVRNLLQPITNPHYWILIR